MHRSPSYHIATGMIALSLLAGGPAAAAAAASSASGGTAVSATAQSSFFADVKPGHWAEKSIVKLALQGIIVGENGNFRPAANVSRQEAVVMALRFMGKEKEADLQQAVIFPESFKVNNYYKPYIALAIKLGLLEETAEFKTAESAKGEWGSSPASREWLTKLIVRAAGKTSLAQELASRASAFQDGASIGAGYVGYINAAGSLGMVTGVTPTQFQPAAAVNRAQAATLFSRAQQVAPVAYPGETGGILTAINGASVSVYTDQGLQTFNLAADSRFYRFDSDASLKSSSELTLYTHVRILGGGMDALYVEQTDPDQQVKTIEGAVSRVVAAQNKIWLWVGDNPVEVQYDSSLVVKKMDGTKLGLADLTVDSQVQVKQDAFRDKPLALEVIVKSAPVSKDGSGTVAAAGNGALSLKTAAGADETWTASSSLAVIGWDGRVLEGGLSGLKAGDAVTYTVKDSVLVSVKVTTAGSASVQGKFSNISDGILTVLAGNSLQSNYLSESVTLVIPGVEQPVLGDLYKDDQLELALDAGGKVTSIKVTNRSLSTLTGAEILSYSSDQKALTVKGTNGKLAALQLSDKTKFEMNGTTLNLATAAPLLRQGQRVTVGYSGSDAMLVRVVYQYTGSVVLLNTATKTLALSLDDGSSVTLPFDTLGVEWYGRSGTGVADIKNGMRVTALLDASQTKAAALRVNQNVQYKITTVDPAAKALSLQAADGSRTTVAAGSLVLKGTDGSALAFTGFAAGQTVNVTYAGSTPTAISLVKVTYGKIAAASADSITLQEYGGSSQTLPLGSGFSIVKGGSAGSSAAALAAGDRVEVKKNADGAVVVTVNAGVAKTFWKVDAAAGQLLMRKSGVNDNDYRFAYTSSTLITAGGQPVAAESLKDGDSIVLYLFEGKLLEAAKA